MSSSICTAGKQALLDAVAIHEWKAALYTSSARLDETTAGYTTDNEVADGDGYLVGGITLDGARVGTGAGKAWLDFEDAIWPSANFTARYMLIYDATDSNRAYLLIDFGKDKTGQGGHFAFRFPPADADNAIIRL
jgi:hypothetical protein